MRKLVTALVLVLGLVPLGAAVPARAHPSPSAAAAIRPAVGHYEGHDERDRLVTFTYTRREGIRHLRINHHLVGRATVSGGSWGRTCHRGFCTWGSWRSNTHVTGHWLRVPSSRSGRGGAEPVSFQVWHSIT